MMYEKLEELNRLNNAMDEIIAGVNLCNELLETEYKQQEKMRLNEFMDAMHELAGYAKNLSCKTFRTDIVFEEKRYSYNDWDKVLIFKFNEDGNFQIQANISSHDGCIYASEFAEYEYLPFQRWRYMSYEDFEYGWGYDKNKSKKFIAIHANEILDAVRKMIEDKFSAEIKAKADKAYKRQSQLIIDIERIKK